MVQFVRSTWNHPTLSTTHCTAPHLHLALAPPLWHLFYLGSGLLLGIWAPVAVSHTVANLGDNPPKSQPSLNLELFPQLQLYARADKKEQTVLLHVARPSYTSVTLNVYQHHQKCLPESSGVSSSPLHPLFLPLYRESAHLPRRAMLIASAMSSSHGLYGAAHLEAL